MPALQRILYVEDEEDIQSIAAISLCDVGGFDVCICSSGEEALQRAEAYKPDLIILDVMMPKMDGPTTLQHLRAIPALANTPVIFMTAKIQSSELENYKQLGALGTIAKPFDPMLLAQQVDGFWQAHLKG